MLLAGATEGRPVGPVEALGGGSGFTVRDPAGRRFRVVQGDTAVAPARNDAHRPVRLAHVNVNTADIDRDIAFYEEGCGFRMTDRSRMMGFLQTNADHHAVVLAETDIDT